MERCAIESPRIRFSKMGFSDTGRLGRQRTSLSSPKSNQTAAALQRIKELPDTYLLKDFCALALDHCYRKGATAAAQGFAELLRQQLQERLGKQLAPLNLKSEPKPETKSESESEPRTGRREAERMVVTNGMEDRGRPSW